MKFFRESILLLSIYFAYEIISKLLILPIPRNVIGMILLFFLLTTNVVKIEKVENLANFFLNHLAFFFIPAAVGLMNSFASLKGSIFNVTVLTIVLSGIIGAVVGPTVFKVLRINHPIAKGVSLGTASHAVGTSKALEIGETEGVMSSLSIGVAGVITVFLAPICYSLLSIFM